jgi:hypothetical protein
MAEQVAGNVGPDVLTEETEEDVYARKRRRLVIRHSSDDRVVALVENLSPGNKASRDAIHSFVEKAAGVLRQGIHLLVIDLQPRTPRDPQGIHALIWGEFADSTITTLLDKPLTLVSYATDGARKRAYLEPVAVGDVLPDMPLYLTPQFYVNVPLETTNCASFEAVPRRWREVLEKPRTAAS